jgi:type II secretory pathway pseudopilin PulG
MAGEGGYILPLVMIVLMVMGMMAAVLLASISVNQQHVTRDRAYSQSLAIAEAGLNQYLWMVASGESSEANDFAIAGNTGSDVHTMTAELTDLDSDVKGSYTIQVAPPTASSSQITVTVTGTALSPADASRTISATIGRPSFSEYVLLVDEAVSIGGPLTRVWHGKTHSNTQIKIETANINDLITCAKATNSGKPGVYSDNVPASDASRSLWQFPVPAVDFDSVTADFARLNDLATGSYNLPYCTPSPASAAHGWYIKLLPDEKLKIARVTAEVEQSNYVNGLNRGGYLTYGSWSSVMDYPPNGVIFSNDNVWVEGTDLDGRITIAASGQFNGTGRTASINIINDLTYSAKDGTVAVGLIGQENVKIPMYAPMGKSGTMGTNLNNMGTVNMEIDAAIIAQTGKEFVNYNGVDGPKRNLLKIYGSISTRLTPVRMSYANLNYAGFGQGENVYDSFLLHNPPPYFPTVGSYQILDWRELPSTYEIEPET